MTLIVPVVISVLALAFAGWLVSWINKQDMGTPKMKEIYEAIKKGANAFLKRQYQTFTEKKYFFKSLVDFIIKCPICTVYI